MMRVDMLASLVPFASQGDVEQIIVDAIKHSYLQVCAAIWSRVHGPPTSCLGCCDLHLLCLHLHVART